MRIDLKDCSKQYWCFALDCGAKA